MAGGETANATGMAGTVVVGGDAPDLQGMTSVTQQYTDQLAAISEQMEQLRQTTEALNRVSTVLLDSYKAITDNSENISESSTGTATLPDSTPSMKSS